MLGRGVVGDISLTPPPLSASGDGVCERLTDRKVAAIFVSEFAADSWEELFRRETGRILREDDAALKKPVACL